jgi:hypothetical protein
MDLGMKTGPSLAADYALTTGTETGEQQHSAEGSRKHSSPNYLYTSNAPPTSSDTIQSTRSNNYISS